MFVYCLWSGDRYENNRILLAHQNRYCPDEFKAICDKARKELIESTSKNHEIMDTVNDVKSIWEYSIADGLLKDLKKVLVENYGFHEIGVLNNYHVVDVDPYDYPKEKEGGI